jgi:hypothetical protein
MRTQILGIQLQASEPFFAGETQQFVNALRNQYPNTNIVNALVAGTFDFGPTSKQEVLHGHFDINTAIGLRVNFQTWVNKNV